MEEKEKKHPSKEHSLPCNTVNSFCIASVIDHTLLKPDATESDIKRLCEEALAYGFASVCVNQCWTKLVSRLLQNSQVKTCTVIGFPLGASTTEVKVFETRNAVSNGAQEVDMVINVGTLKSGKFEEVKRDINEVIKASGSLVKVKVILETCYLSDKEKVKASVLAMEAGADFVKTSTGFGPGGATAHDVALLRKTVNGHLGIKAAGGIRSYEKAIEMIEAGATRIGTSAGIQIVKQA